MEQLTVKELKILCDKAIKEGHGNKHIVVADDNEGNGFHGMFYGFTPLDDSNYSMFSNDIYDSNYNKKEDTIVLG